MSLSDVLVEVALTDMRDRLLSGTFEDFAEVFDAVIESDTAPGLAQDVWDTIIGWGKDGIVIEQAYSPAVYKNAHVIIAVSCEKSAAHEVFNHTGEVRQISAQDPKYGIEFGGPVEDMIGIYIMSPSRWVMRFLDLLIKSTIYAAGRWFTQNGTSGAMWQTTSELQPVNVMMGTETVQKYVRKQAWTVFNNLVIRPFGGTVVTPKPILVHAEGTFVSKVPNPDTRTFTDLDGTSAGGVTPVLPEDE